MTWAPGDKAQCVKAFPSWCEPCKADHPVPQFMNVYEVTQVYLPDTFELLFMDRRDGPYLFLSGPRGGYWHEHFRKVEPAPPEEDEEVGEREKETVTW